MSETSTEKVKLLRGLLAKATPKPARNRGEHLTLRARHFGDSTEITFEHTADTVAIIDDGCPEHEVVADLFVAAINALPALLDSVEPKASLDREQLVSRIGEILEADPACGGRVTNDSIEAIADLCAKTSLDDGWLVERAFREAYELGFLEGYEVYRRALPGDPDYRDVALRQMDGVSEAWSDYCASLPSPADQS